MKKYIIMIIISIIVISGIVGGTIYYIMAKRMDELENKIQSENMINNSSNNEKDKVKNNTQKQQQSTTNKTQTTKKAKYSHVAIQGCIITESNPNSSSFTYKKKCESCGNVEPGTTSTSASSGTLNSSFMCFKCKKTQKIQIESSVYYE